MRELCMGAVTILFATTNPAIAESKWLESKRLEVSEVRGLCEQVSGVRLLGRMQMVTVGDERWRRLSRQELAIEAAVMGVAPLDPSRCYLVVQAGSAGERERRAFEVRDFVTNAEETSVFVLGRAYDHPAGGVMHPDGR